MKGNGLIIENKEMEFSINFPLSENMRENTWKTKDKGRENSIIRKERFIQAILSTMKYKERGDFSLTKIHFYKEISLMGKLRVLEYIVILIRTKNTQEISTMATQMDRDKYLMMTDLNIKEHLRRDKETVMEFILIRTEIFTKETGLLINDMDMDNISIKRANIMETGISIKNKERGC